MRKQLMLIFTLSALLTYRPGHAQARPDGLGDSPTLVASTKAKPTATRSTADVTATKTAVATKKETGIKKSQNSLNRIWLRIMGYCHEVHTASQKKN